MSALTAGRQLLGGPHGIARALAEVVLRPFAYRPEDYRLSESSVKSWRQRDYGLMIKSGGFFVGGMMIISAVVDGNGPTLLSELDALTGSYSSAILLVLATAVVGFAAMINAFVLVARGPRERGPIFCPQDLQPIMRDTLRQVWHSSCQYDVKADAEKRLHAVGRSLIHLDRVPDRATVARVVDDLKAIQAAVRQ